LEAEKSNLYGYNKNLKGFARANRNSMTKAEACLWKYVLKASQMKGYPFRRQRPVLNYIADFMCKELKLIIEVDGITHHDENIIKNDKRRQKKLEQAGFTVMRFDDKDVLTSINWVTEEIENWIEQLRHLNPPPKRDIETQFKERP